jgi:hypothetical protein
MRITMANAAATRDSSPKKDPVPRADITADAVSGPVAAPIE